MSLGTIAFLLEILGEGWIVVPYGFTINGTSNADGLIPGNVLSSVVFDEAGEYTCTLASYIGKPKCIFGFCTLSETADDVDIYGRVDWSTVESAGTFKVRFMTGATQTTPTDNRLAGGFLLCKKNDRGL